MGAPHERAFCVAVPLYKFIVVFYLSRSSLFPFVKSIPLLLLLYCSPASCLCYVAHYLYQAYYHTSLFRGAEAGGDLPMNI